MYDSSNNVVFFIDALTNTTTLTPVVSFNTSGSNTTITGPTLALETW